MRDKQGDGIVGVQSYPDPSGNLRFHLQYSYNDLFSGVLDTVDNVGYDGDTANTTRVSESMQHNAYYDLFLLAVGGVPGRHTPQPISFPNLGDHRSAYPVPPLALTQTLTVPGTAINKTFVFATSVVSSQ